MDCRNALSMGTLVALVTAKQQVSHVGLSAGRYITHQLRSTISGCGGLTFSDFTGRAETGDATGGPTEGSDE